ncbi:MAG: hypothetical protein RAO92_05070 [Candidatus Euphemobacter frigidus]|nr:hypothetical protein [Candidatus Euphemobacter frigidus]MDP8275755.1 hypothetical protein [Candidatus Euphemobacter frigidus]
MLNLPYLLMSVMIFTAGAGGEECGGATSAPLVSSPSPAPSPSLSPTSRSIPVELFFRRPARIIPVDNQKGEFEIVQEVPWLTENDIAGAFSNLEADPPILRFYLTPEGKRKYREAMMGNVGRTIIFTIDGTVRKAFKMVPVRRKDWIHLVGNFSPEEAGLIMEQINNRPSPTPTPKPMPTPPKRQQFIIQ